MDLQDTILLILKPLDQNDDPIWNTNPGLILPAGIEGVVELRAVIPASALDLGKTLKEDVSELWIRYQSNRPNS